MAIDLGVTIKQLIDEINSLSADTSNFVTTDTEQNITGKKTFKAPTNVSNTEQVTTWVETSNGGRVGFGKEKANSGTAIFFDQVSGTRRLNFRASSSVGAMVWEQPEKNARLYFDFGNPSGSIYRVTMPNKQGTLALTSQIPTKVSELTNDNGYTDNKGTVTQVKVNGTTKSPDSNGLVDLGTISSGGGSYTFVEDPSKTYVKYKGTDFGTDIDDNTFGVDCSGEATVDWGDGTVENYTSGDHPAHIYTDGNAYHLITISGDIDWRHHPFYENNYVEEIIFTNTLNSDYTTVNGELDSLCYGCENLKIVKMQAATPPQLNEYYFDFTPALEKIIVPKSASSAYKASWSNLADKIVYLTDSSDLSSGGGGMPIYIKANTGIKGNGDYNINVTILSGINELRVGDRIQVCIVSSSVWHISDGTTRRRKRLRCIDYYEVSNLDIGRRYTYSINTCSSTQPYDIWQRYKRSGTKTGSYLRRPVSVRIVRCLNNNWNSSSSPRTILSNIVQLGTSVNAVIPL